MNSFKTLPDAIVCASDYVAHIIYDYCFTKKIAVPKDLILTGYDNSTEYDNIANKITTADVDTHLIGSRLTSELTYRIARPDAPIAKTYIYPSLILK